MPRSFLIKKHHHLGCGVSTAELLEVAERSNNVTRSIFVESVAAKKEDINYDDDKGPYDLSTKSPARKVVEPATIAPAIAKPLPLTPLNLNTQYPSPYNVWVPRVIIPPHASYIPYNFNQVYQYGQQITASGEQPQYGTHPVIDTESPQVVNSSSSTPSPTSSAESDSSTSVGPSDAKKPRKSDPQRLQCCDCGKSYSTYSGLTKHRHIHCAIQNKKSFNCKFCEKTYVSLGALKMHIRTHTLPCKCHLCGKAFSRPWLLQGHIRTHTGEKPFACNHCNRAFADRSNLRAHLQTHSDVKKYCCQRCSKTFSRMSLLLKHEEACSAAPAPSR